MQNLSTTKEMKLLFNRISIWAFICLLGLVACKKEEQPLPEPSHRVVVTSEMDYDNKVRVDGTITFGDVSAGVLSRTWTFPEGVVDILESDNDLTSEEATVKVRFLTVGEHEVNLRQTFENAAYVGETVTERELDTTILITVLDSIAVTVEAFHLNPDGTLGDALIMEDGAENEVQAGGTVRFTYQAIGEPLDFLWQLEGGNPGTVNDDRLEVDVKYTQLGTYGVYFQASRPRPGGRDTAIFDDLVTVIPSAEPVTLDDVVKQGDDIALVFSREMEASSLEAGSFSVLIENDGNTLTPSVGQASIDATQGNIVLLTLSGETLYDDDVVKVSYQPGAMRTTDGTNADAFSDEVMRVEKVNLLEQTSYDYGFENSFVSNWTYLGWGAPWDGFTLDVTGNQSYDGGKSLQIDMTPAGGMIIGHRDQNGEHVFFDVDKDKDYEIGVWVYVESIGSTPAGQEQPNLRFYWNPATDWAQGDNPNLSALPQGEWTYSSVFARFGETGPTRFMIRGVNANNPEGCRVFIDNITLAEVQLRP